MAKSVQDLYDLYRVLVEDESGQAAAPPLPTSGFQNLTVGFLDPEVWIFGDEYLHPLPGLKEQLVSVNLPQGQRRRRQLN
jgi:hypothetical protein